MHKVQSHVKSFVFNHKSLLIVVLLFLLAGILFFSFKGRIIERAVNLAKKQYHLYVSRRSASGDNFHKDPFIYLSSDGSIAPEKLVAYTNGSVSPPGYPYRMVNFWKLAREKEWRGEDSLDKKEYSWELLDGYLPILITKHDYIGIKFESTIFCEAKKRIGKRSLGFKRFKVKNTSNQPVEIHIKTEILFQPDQQHVPIPFSQGYDIQYMEIPAGQFVSIGSIVIICNKGFTEQTISLASDQSVVFDYQMCLPDEMSEGIENPILKDAEDELVKTRDYWVSKLIGFSSKFRESDDKKAMLAALMQILMAGKGVIKPTCFYKTAFIRDGVMIAHALNVAGLTDLAQAQLNYYLENPWASGFGPEADAPGELIWMMSDYVKHSGDQKYLEAHWPTIKRIAGIIIAIIETKSDYVVQGIKIAQRDGDIVLGRMDFAMRPVYCNVWLLAGLREALYLAGIVGDIGFIKKHEKKYSYYKKCFNDYIQNNIDRLIDDERTFISGLHPTEIFDKDQEFIKEMYRKHWMKTDRWVAGPWPYFDFAQATAHKLLGEDEKSEIIYNAIKLKYPGYKYGLFFEGDNDEFMPHLWAAAEAFSYFYIKISGIKDVTRSEGRQAVPTR